MIAVIKCMWLLNAYLIHQWFPTLSPDSPGMLVNKALFSWSSSQPTESEPLRNSLRTCIFYVSIADRSCKFGKRWSTFMPVLWKTEKGRISYSTEEYGRGRC